MIILMASADNPYINNIGGKHVHLLLLEKSLRKLGVNVETKYYQMSSLKRKLLMIFKSALAVYSKRERIISSIEIIRDFYKKQDYSNFDIVNPHDTLSASAINHRKIVLTIHGYFPRELLDYSNFSENTKEKIFNFAVKYEKIGVEKAKHIIAVDTRIKNYLVKELGVDKKKITVIYNAVDIDNFSPVNESEKKRLRRYLGLETDKYIVLIPRRFVPKNGVQYAAEAVKIINASLVGKQLFFIFSGRGLLENELRSRLSKFSNVIITRLSHNEIVKYYKASDIVLIPSITSNDVEEATSLSMLEGMSTGKIVICTNIGGMKEVIKDGINGFLIPQKSPEAIAEKIEYVINHYHELEEIRRNARGYVISHHSPEEHAEKFLEVYKKIFRI
ncbi:glycosyltransferase family 4 protein [Thermosipho ferrireducens]|uniref:Glycosyltransferase family 4 protein n=1 Tax=Thermosipho ferrireducens TaxID=2571116 RepID=A0ABX7S7J2_9BACT|nr:glycosyltransferase family 4 protein [Thermosipho ferrireducens]QTA38563.1 glycosyltransferase family 4 protein [Thermosipho ferrireducens]